MVNSKKSVLPSKIVILEILETEGRIYETKLREILEDVYGDFSQTLLNNKLMSLESEGLIIVSESGSSKGKIIEHPRGKRYVKIGEE